MKITEQLKPALINHWTNKAFKTFYPNVKFYPTIAAPNSWSRLQAFVYVLDGYGSLPVFSGSCDQTIYNNATENVTFRAWHDCIHLQHGLSFQVEAEKQVGKIHCDQLRAIGAPVHVINAVYFDVVGQIEYHSQTREFVKNQREFVQNCIIHGLEKAIGITKQTELN